MVDKYKNAKNVPPWYYYAGLVLIDHKWDKITEELNKLDQEVDSYKNHMDESQYRDYKKDVAAKKAALNGAQTRRDDILLHIEVISELWTKEGKEKDCKRPRIWGEAMVDEYDRYRNGKNFASLPCILAAIQALQNYDGGPTPLAIREFMETVTAGLRALKEQKSTKK